jgi:hypothetical protein
MKLRAYNLIKGVVYRTGTVAEEKDFVATYVIWDRANKVVKVYARDVTTDKVEPHIFDFDEIVDLVGISVHPEDPDETDFGTN